MADDERARWDRDMRLAVGCGCGNSDARGIDHRYAWEGGCRPYPSPPPPKKPNGFVCEFRLPRLPGAGGRRAQLRRHMGQPEGRVRARSGCSPRRRHGMSDRRPCTCRRYLDDGRPNRNPDGSVKEVTVACDVHHVMADGAPASLHEVLCTCGTFADARECTVYMDQGGEPEHVCNSEGCAAVLIKDCGFRLPTDQERREWRLPDPAALRGDT